MVSETDFRILVFFASNFDVVIAVGLARKLVAKISADIETEHTTTSQHKKGPRSDDASKQNWF